MEREQVADIPLETILQLIEDIKDEEDSSKKIRKMFEKHTKEELKNRYDEIMEMDSNNSGYLLQDLVNAIGLRLGFETEYGRYHGLNRNTIDYDGLWEMPIRDGHSRGLVIETKKSTTYLKSIEEQPGKYMAQLESNEDREFSELHGLLVIGSGDKSSVINEIRGYKHSREFSGDIRVITVDDLLLLLELSNNTNIAGAEISKLLFPINSIDAGNLISTVSNLVTDWSDSEEMVSGTPQDIPKIKKEQIAGDRESNVAIYSTTPESVNGIFKRYRAYGTVQEPAKHVDYIALYVTGTVGIKYIGKVEEIVDAVEFEDEYSEDFSGKSWYDESKIFYKCSDVYELDDLISYPEFDGRKDRHTNFLKGLLRYISLEGFKNAETTLDIQDWGK